MIHASRRKILSLFAAAPAALPVAIKEAAEKAGIASIAAAAPAPDIPHLEGPSWDGQIKWLKDQLLNIGSDKQQHERRRRAEEQAYRLNPNLASLRSMSPAVAYHIEVERQFKLLEERDRLSTQHSITEALRQQAMGTRF